MEQQFVTFKFTVFILKYMKQKWRNRRTHTHKWNPVQSEVSGKQTEGFKYRISPGRKRQAWGRDLEHSCLWVKKRIIYSEMNQIFKSAIILINTSLFVWLLHSWASLVSHDDPGFNATAVTMNWLTPCGTIDLTVRAPQTPYRVWTLGFGLCSTNKVWHLSLC